MAILDTQAQVQGQLREWFKEELRCREYGKYEYIKDTL
jgi:hypothetical protein